PARRDPGRERRARRPPGRAGGREPGPRAGERARGAGAGAGQRGRGQQGVTAGDQRRVAVPEGLDGERLDAALARMFGLSRATAADLVTSGNVLVDGRPAAKSQRVPAGEWLEVTLPPPPSSFSNTTAPQPVPGLVIVAEDEDIVVVD